MSERSASSSLPAFSDYEPETIRAVTDDSDIPEKNNAASVTELASGKPFVNLSSHVDDERGKSSLLMPPFRWLLAVSCIIVLVFLVTLPVTIGIGERKLHSAMLVTSDQPSAAISENDNDLSSQPLFSSESEQQVIQAREADTAKALVAEQLQQELQARVQARVQARLEAERAALLVQQKQFAEQVQAEADAALKASQAKLVAEEQRLESVARQLAERKVLLVEQEQSARKRQVQMEIALAEKRAELRLQLETVVASNQTQENAQATEKTAARLQAEKRTAQQRKIESASQEKLVKQQAEFLAALQDYAAQQRQRVEKQAEPAVTDVPAKRTAAAVVNTPVPDGPMDDIAVLFSRVESGNITYLQRYLKNGGSPDQVNNDGTPLLVRAASLDQYIVASELLRTGANVNLANNRGESALQLAAANGHNEMVSLLLSKRANTNQVTPEGTTALMSASARDFREIVVALLEAGADVKLRNRNGRSALDYARENSHAALSRFLTQIIAESSLVAQKDR